jgi:hypothetical protein
LLVLKAKAKVKNNNKTLSGLFEAITEVGGGRFYFYLCPVVPALLIFIPFAFALAKVIIRIKKRVGTRSLSYFYTLLPLLFLKAKAKE